MCGYRHGANIELAYHIGAGEVYKFLSRELMPIMVYNFQINVMVSNAISFFYVERDSKIFISSHADWFERPV